MVKKKYILVNKDNPYNPKNYEGSEMVSIDIPVSNDNELIESDVVHTDENGQRWVKTYIERSTYNSFLKLKQRAMEKYGLDIEIIDAGRTLEKQAKYYQNAVEAVGREFAESHVAKPGCSEHHTGFAFDYAIKMPEAKSIKNPILKKYYMKVKKVMTHSLINNEAAKLGLALRYPVFGRRFTGYRHERWHLSNVEDPILSSYLRSHNMSLEYFYANASKLSRSYNRFAENFTRKNPELVLSEECRICM